MANENPLLAIHISNEMSKPLHPHNKSIIIYLKNFFNKNDEKTINPFFPKTKLNVYFFPFLS